MTSKAHDFKKGFTLVELLAVIAIVALLAATLLPALASTTDHTRRVECANNLRQIAVVLVTYTGEYNDYMPALKWRDSNPNYPYEMFRYSPQNVIPPTYEPNGGPYNLGMLWSSGILKDGHVFYCPGRPDSTDNNFTYQYYTQMTNWPFGGNPFTINNPDYVRSGYYYCPQSKMAKIEPGSDAPVHNPVIPFWPPFNDPANSFVYQTWICVPPFKMSGMDTSKSMVTDYFNSGLNNLSHGYGSNPTGLNAVFPDGHVNWQSARGNPNTFDPTLWQIISGPGAGGATLGLDIRYVLSTLK